MIKLSTVPLMLLASMLATGAHAGDRSVPVPGSWIVELEAPPTLEYRGQDQVLMQSSGDRAGKPLAPTAPEAKGGRRFDAQASEVQQYAAFLDQERENVVREASAMLGREIEQKAVYRHVMNGFSTRMSVKEARRLADMPGVAKVLQNRAYPLHLDEGPDLIGAPNVWTGINGSRGEGVVVGIIDSGINWDHSYFSDDPADTGGYDFENPLGSQLGECSKPSVPCNDKLIGVWNFADEGTDGKDPEGGGHGTHVASTAAGNPWAFSLSNIPNKTFRTSGVAPRANIISYKVCYTEHPTDDEQDGNCDSSSILQALDQAIEDGVDIVNYSIGGSAIDPWQNTVAQKILNMRSAGILFVSSAGNSGPDLGTISAPANAPWVMAVASNTHQRRIGNRARVSSLSNIFIQPGAEQSWEEDISGAVWAADDAGSGKLGCQSYPANALDGAIALVKRGECTFETKVNNAADAGAIAVLVYNNVPGQPITMGGVESTTIPSAMMDLEQGKLAVAAIDPNGNSSATLFADTAAVTNRNWQDVVSDFSSRGPGADTPGVLKPNVSAPGQEILGGSVPDANSLAVLSGTSMASPHVAGAAALLKSIHPDWTPDVIQSVLETTAVTAPMTFNEGPATALDRGNGRIRVDRAARAGLYLPVSTSNFENANPNTGGDPAQLNLAGMYSEDCKDGCQFTRTVRALEAGSWNVSVEGDLNVTVTPSSFDLSEGQQRDLTIKVAPGGLSLNALRENDIVLTEDGGLPEQRLRLAVRRGTELIVEANRGQESVASPVESALPEARFRTSALVKPNSEQFSLPQDLSATNPYSGSQGRRTFLVDVKEGTLALKADIVASSADDIDLYVGFDEDGDGEAELSEEACSSTSANEIERCEISAPDAGQWWILVQNWTPSSAPEDSVSLEYAVLDAAGDPSLVASGRGIHEGGPLDVDLYWDQPAMRKGETWIGAVGFSSTPDDLADLGVAILSLTREGSQPIEATPLFAGETRPVIVPASSTHDRLFIDVPAGTDLMQVAVSGDSGVEAELRRIDFADTAVHVPGTPAPTTAAVASGTGSASGIEFSLEPEEGRWYVVLTNTRAREALVDVKVSLEESFPHLSRRALWSPRDRSINQGIEWQESAGTEFIVWYTYDEAGLPVFYNGVAAGNPGSSIWQADILRTTSIGLRNNVDTIGRMQITQLGPEEMMVAWRMNGRYGAERFTPDIAPTCPEQGGTPASYTGHWNVPGVSQGGTTMIVTEASQAQVRYYFDDLGVGRWVITSDSAGAGPLAEQLDVLELRGFCPTCEEEEITIETVGSYSRIFDDTDSATEIIEFDSLPPLNQTYSTEVSIEKLSSPLGCQ